MTPQLTVERAHRRPQRRLDQRLPAEPRGHDPPIGIVQHLQDGDVDAPGPWPSEVVPKTSLTR